MVEIEIDGVKVQVPEGSMLMEATNRAGKYVPHFCYHKKLSIAANCRMCLVEVEKAPKPLPACATPVTAGMIVRTASEKAINAQKSVMEFLLINHPLDCPICDQGGECQLQDLAVGYGGSASRYQEEKRVVFHKDIGPLVSAQEMSRCIHCTRCVRFGQEVAGVMELGMAGRGEHSEILSFVGNSVDSELSGNMIDLCPVGALTSKPFRYSARTWELARRRSVTPHDSLGSNVVVQVKGDKVLRVLPIENEAINECWITDKDRFSYEGLNAADRVTVPMVKRGDEWVEIDWEAALTLVSAGLKDTRDSSGANTIGVLASPSSTLEELALAGKLVRGLGSNNIDVRLRQSDFSLDASRQGAPWLGMPVADISTLDRVLVVGSFLRKDHPLVAQRLRQTAKRGAKVFSLNATCENWLVKMAGQLTVAPSQWESTLAQLIVAVAAAKGVTAPAAFAGLAASAQVSAIAAQLVTGQTPGVLIGNAAVQHPSYARLAVLLQTLAELLGAKWGYLTESANTVGAYVAGAVPSADGKNAAQMLAGGMKSLILLNTEPDLDSADGQQALTTLTETPFVVALTSFKSRVSQYANIILPITPFTETSGTFISAEGRVQSFQACVRPAGQARPGWKVLRVLGNLLGLSGFDANSSDDIKKSVLTGDVADRLNNASSAPLQVPVTATAQGLERIADVSIYATDALVRRAESLQLTKDAKAPVAHIHPQTLQTLNLGSATAVAVAMNGHPGAQLPWVADDTVAVGAIRIAAGRLQTLPVGPLFGSVQVSAVHSAVDSTVKA